MTHSAAVANAQLRRVVECPNCGLTQVADRGERAEITHCHRCRKQIEHAAGKSLNATLACAIGILLLLPPLLFEPFLTTQVFGATRTSTLPLSSFMLWRDGWPLLAIIVFLFIIVFPIVRFISMTIVLLTLRSSRRPPWLARLFRLCNALQTWAMLDVFLLGLAVAYARLRASIEVTLDTGAVCFVAAAVLSVVARATLDKAEVWRLIAPDALGGSRHDSVLCRGCELLVKKSPPDVETLTCPRCSAALHARQPESLQRSGALLLGAALLYLPANFFPIATIPIDLKPTAYTVLGGVVDLVRSHLVGLALLVFSASFTIPLLKMIGLSWCALSVTCRSYSHLLAKTRVYRIIEEIGRWSMVDPLTIACFVPVMKFNGLMDGRAEPAATPFALVVILTSVAIKAFDPRLMWDAAGRNT